MTAIGSGLFERKPFLHNVMILGIEADRREQSNEKDERKTLFATHLNGDISMRNLTGLNELERQIIKDQAMIAALAGCNKSTFNLLKMNKPHVGPLKLFALLLLPDPIFVHMDRFLAGLACLAKASHT